MAHNIPISNAIPYSVFDAAFYAIISGYDVTFSEYKRVGGRSIRNRQESPPKHVVFINRIEGMQDAVPPDAISNEYGVETIRDAYSRERAPQLYFVTKARIDRSFWVEEKDGSRHQFASWSLTYDDGHFWLYRKAENKSFHLCAPFQAGGVLNTDYDACTPMLSEEDRMMLIDWMREWEKSVGAVHRRLEDARQTDDDPSQAVGFGKPIPGTSAVADAYKYSTCTFDKADVAALVTRADVAAAEPPAELAEEDKCCGGACHVINPQHHIDAWKERQPRPYKRQPWEVLKTRADVAAAAKRSVGTREKSPSATAEDA